MLNARALTLQRQGRTLLADIDVDFPAGSFTAILGPNGAGKSSLLNLLAGLDTPSQGQCSLHDQPLQALGVARLARQRALLTQHTALAFPFSVAEVAAMGLEPFPEYRGRHCEWLTQQLAALELGSLATRQYPTLSGGERQRVQLARCLLQWQAAHRLGPAAALLLDEPTSAMDLRQQLLALQHIQAAARAGGIVIAVLHDINLAAQFADRWVLLREGRIHRQGPVDSVCRDDVLAAVFDVDCRRHRDPCSGRVTITLEGLPGSTQEDTPAAAGATPAFRS